MFCSCHATILRKTNHFFILFFQRFSAFYPFFNFFLKRSVFLLSVVLGDAQMGRLYFVAPHSNNIEQQRTTRDNFFVCCFGLSLARRSNNDMLRYQRNMRNNSTNSGELLGIYAEIKIKTSTFATILAICGYIDK